MKAILSTIDTILCIAFILGLVFLFKGDPDLWDKLHARAMNWGCAPAATAQSEGAGDEPR